jgi:hypothetical protein
VKNAYLVLALLAAPACGKHNEIDVLVHEVTAIAKHSAPQLEALDKRVQAIFQRGATIPATTPGIEAVGTKLTEARDMIVNLRGQVSPSADGKSAIEKQAAEAAKNRRINDLTKLVHDTEASLERGMTVINADLQSVESWIAYYDRKALAGPVAPVTPPPPPTTTPDPGATPPAVAPAPPQGGPPTGGVAPTGGTVPTAPARP